MNATLEENYQLLGVCPGCRTVRPVFPVHYERQYRRLCVRCWARNMRFVEIRDPACFHCGKPIVDGGFFFDWPSFGWIDTHAECFLATIKALRNADADEAGRELTAQIAQADAAGDELRVDALLREKDRLNRERAGTAWSSARFCPTSKSRITTDSIAQF